MKRLLALLIDATDPDLIEKWMADGSLPNFRRLREAGAYGRLSSTADWMAEATHYVFNTGRNPGATGLVAYSIWQKETMLSRTPTPDWLPSVPFWRSLQAGDARAIIVDPPDVYAPVSFNGLEVVGWATHDTLVPFQTFPPELARRIDDRFGSSLMPDESYGPMRKHDFLEDVRLLQTINRNFEA
ncbi:MAG TPA: alkaline phosphatase family protein, partial [Anaerolineales bacterium]